RDEGSDIREWVNSFLMMEDHIREILDEVRRLQTRQEYESADDLLRNLWESRKGAFRVVYLSVFDVGDFFEDVEEHVGQDARNKLVSLESDYSDLFDTFERAYYEYGEEIKNPVKRGSVGYSYDIDENTPITEYTLYSGERPVFETHNYPSEIAHMAYLWLDAASGGVERAVEKDLPVSEEEISDISKKLDEISEEIDDFRSALEETRQPESSPQLSSESTQKD
ncbi:MAG: hypothetical protein ABEI13_00160, partial [Candidatus Paceibacteria bacterium]